MASPNQKFKDEQKSKSSKSQGSPTQRNKPDPKPVKKDPPKPAPDRETILTELDTLMNESGTAKTSGSGGGGVSNDVLSGIISYLNPGLGAVTKYGGPAFETIMKNTKSIFGDRPVGKEILEKLAAGVTLSTEEKLELIDLQKKLNKEEGFNEFSFDDDSTYLNREIGKSTIGDLLSNSGIVDKGLLNELTEQRYNNQDLIDEQEDLNIFQKMQQGLGFNMPEGYLSQTDAMKQLGPEQLAALQRLYPETYYGDSTEKDDYLGFKPRSQRELEDLAAMDISAAKGNEGLVREIARARETLRREGREAPAGIASLAPVLPPASPPITTPSPPLVLPGLPSPTPTPVNPETLPIMPGNQTANQYTQLGIPQVAPNLPGGFAPGNFGDYYNYLNQFYNTTRR